MFDHFASVLGLGFGLPGNTEWIVLLVLGVLIFGRRLPEVGRGIGRSIVEFKKGIKGIEDEIETQSSTPAPASEPVRQVDSTYTPPLPDGQPAASPASSQHSASS
ncbi:MAG: twin-arginine translocase TatA/TatE family subunit [Phycisphaerales bacterium]